MTEINREGREALKRRAMCACCHCPPIFCDNASLTTQTPKDGQGSFQDLPVADILFLGIVCVDISACSSTPKSLEDPIRGDWEVLVGLLEVLGQPKLRAPA